MKKVTQQDIADMLGISRTTVARALNGTGPVDENTRKKVIETARKLNYQINPIARTLARQKTVGVSVFCAKTSNDHFNHHIEAGFNLAFNEFKHFGVKYNLYWTSTEDPDKQVEKMYAVLEKDKDIDGVIVMPLNVEKVKEIARVCKEKNIEFGTVNMDIDCDDRLFFVGNDDYSGGRIAGDILSNLLTGRGNIAIIGSVYQYVSSYKRLKGFMDIVMERSHLDISTWQNVKDLDEAYKITKQILKEKTDIHGIFTTVEILYVARALKELGKRDVVLVGYDLNKKVKSYIKQGIINSVLYQRPFLQGYLALKYMLNYLIYENTTPTKEVTIGYDIVTKENLKVEELYLKNFLQQPVYDTERTQIK
ncbi:LacI family DNA-binding transcriptional regulator [Halothermothrix orenii]|uniref:Regulatory protein LacI n=1 Tax=Halothermothrix orenii (strain H 168 / OCM 544 / DSM 9562) TaxID=373903 RepID=B8CWN1_HALOH|nr:LacI family DNA-binding transcriptional regulator [Halothermothrix orenii]ACL69700.1 regulatory protein LacI [Halothermothrix orenii H 168]